MPDPGPRPLRIRPRWEPRGGRRLERVRCLGSPFGAFARGFAVERGFAFVRVFAFAFAIPYSFSFAFAGVTSTRCRT